MTGTGAVAGPRLGRWWARTSATSLSTVRLNATIEPYADTGSHAQALSRALAGVCALAAPHGPCNAARGGVPSQSVPEPERARRVGAETVQRLRRTGAQQLAGVRVVEHQGRGVDADPDPAPAEDLRGQYQPPGRNCNFIAPWLV